MIFYVSGELEDSVLDYIADSGTALLTSFAYPKVLEHRSAYLAARLRSTKKKILHMLDSGAFTTWNKGGEISLNKLCDTANRMQDEYSDCFDWTFVALDAIPGVKGHDITPEDIAVACKRSAENYNVMRRRVAGYVKPVFHVGDPDWLIQVYADANYVGMGFSQSITERARVTWAKRNTAKFFGKRLHGLAATGWNMLCAAPWYSVDSFSAMRLATVGKLVVQRPNKMLAVMPITDRVSERKTTDAHYNTLSDSHQEMVRNQIEQAGFKVDQLKSELTARSIWNIQQYSLQCQSAEIARRNQPQLIQELLF